MNNQGQRSPTRRFRHSKCIQPGKFGLAAQRSMGLNESNPYGGSFGYSKAAVLSRNSLNKQGSWPDFYKNEDVITAKSGLTRLESSIPYLGTIRDASEQKGAAIQSALSREGHVDIIGSTGQSHLTDEIGGSSFIVSLVSPIEISQEDRFSSRHLNDRHLHKFSSITNIGSQSLPPRCHNICSICLDHLTASQELRILSCNHAFHEACIDKWFLGMSSSQHVYNNICPNCKQQPQVTSQSAANSFVNISSLDLEQSQRMEIPSEAFLRVGECLLRNAKTMSSDSMVESKGEFPGTTQLHRSSLINSTTENGIQMMLFLLDAASPDDDIL